MRRRSTGTKSHYGSCIWCDYNIDTDDATEVPNTGVTREYWLELTDVMVAPGGVSRSAVAINGSIPGPTLFADWGDTMVVHQNFTVQNDGVVAITHAQTSGPPTLDNGLINGTNVYGDDESDSQTGTRFSTDFTSGTSYRLRLVDGANDTVLKFSIDNHTLTVISADFVPIQPYDTTMLTISQIYDVIVTADQADIADSFWMRAIPQLACSDNDSTDNIKGIVFYDGSTTTPTTTGYSYTDSCNDEDVVNLVPVVSKTVDSTFTKKDEPVTLGGNSDSLFRWFMNGTSMDVDWETPTLLQAYNNSTSLQQQHKLREL
ncbi:hypothetical protein LTR84_010474 [Exophiala bonariae]|uniref:Plastocyanin-like domain-containing protein n=1 Tax=Exophiala bonariae TaxID=1690606 RepID=A0AAV9MWU7_9EURO|nr:hypothetical protein LTR84_010474 [Exophiala bonariae]